MKSLLDDVTPDLIETDPFPHVFVPNVMDGETARALSDGFPPFP